MIETKNNGNDWIAEIPAHWEVKRLKDVSYLYSGLTGKAGEDFTSEQDNRAKPYIPFTNVLNNSVINPMQMNYVYFAEGEVQNRVKLNDLIFLMSSEDYDSIGKSAVVLNEFNDVYLNSFCRGLRFTEKRIDSRFVNYLLNSTPCRDSLRFEARGFTRINIKIEKIASQFICYPPLDEQQAIADFLDKKTAEIDNQISLLENKLQALIKLKKSLISEVISHGLDRAIEMKDSGINWIGKIPAHWEIKRMKDVSELYTGKSLNDSQKELYGDLSGADVLPYIGSKDVDATTGSVNYESGYAIPITHYGFPVATKGSSLLCIEGGSAGKKIGQVEKDVYFVNKLCCIKSRLNPKYIYFFLNSNLFSNQFNKNLQGMIGGVSVALIKTFFITYPPLEEQQSIANYLQRKCREIDEQSSLINEKIESYTRLKQSLIDEVVTGQRKI